MSKINLKYKQNFRSQLNKNTEIFLNKKYKAIDLIQLVLSRSGFKRGGAHFNFKNKSYELSMIVRKKQNL